MEFNLKSDFIKDQQFVGRKIDIEQIINDCAKYHNNFFNQIYSPETENKIWQGYLAITEYFYSNYFIENEQDLSFGQTMQLFNHFSLKLKELLHMAPNRLTNNNVNDVMKDDDVKTDANKLENPAGYKIFSMIMDNITKNADNDDHIDVENVDLNNIVENLPINKILGQGIDKVFAEQADKIKNKTVITVDEKAQADDIITGLTSIINTSKTGDYDGLSVTMGNLITTIMNNDHSEGVANELFSQGLLRVGKMFTDSLNVDDAEIVDDELDMLRDD